jgi:hypothetical protein
MDSQERLTYANDPVARQIGMLVIAAVVVLVVLRRSNVAAALSASVNT